MVLKLCSLFCCLLRFSHLSFTRCYSQPTTEKFLGAILKLFEKSFFVRGIKKVHMSKIVAGYQQCKGNLQSVIEVPEHDSSAKHNKYVRARLRHVLPTSHKLTKLNKREAMWREFMGKKKLAKFYLSKPRERSESKVSPLKATLQRRAGKYKSGIGDWHALNVSKWNDTRTWSKLLFWITGLNIKKWVCL